MTELLPLQASYRPGAAVEIEIRKAGPGRLTVWSLGELVSTIEVDGDGIVDLGGLPAGGYGVELATAAGVLRTAVEVAEPGRNRMRYGFVVDYSPDRDPAGLIETVRRLHLTDVQFYDWAYRHADLLGGGEEYKDALDQPVSLATVRRLVTSVQGAGARALGYAAVYAAGPGEWEAWKGYALLTASGEPYALGDFLFLLDPATPEWLAHFTGELASAAGRVGFDGFHLDQYGYPKRAVRPDGVVVDVAESFMTVIDGARAALPDARLVFNNVNDFPTWRTASAPQDAVYIEVWVPTVTLGSLAVMVSRARSIAGGKPIVVAAYQNVYDTAPAAAADLATAFTMATLYSHGATQLLAGEADRILVDPYYVRNHAVEPSTALMLRRWYDFLVEHDELLVEPGIVDITAAFAGPYNDDIDVTFSAAAVTESPMEGSVWRRVTQAGEATVLHLINLVGQSDTLWDGPRTTPGDPGTHSIRIRRTGAGTPRVRVADPDASARLGEVPVSVDGDFASAALQPFAVWQMVVVDWPGEGK